MQAVYHHTWQEENAPNGLNFSRENIWDGSIHNTRTAIKSMLCALDWSLKKKEALVLRLKSTLKS